MRKNGTANEDIVQHNCHSHEFFVRGRGFKILEMTPQEKQQLKARFFGQHIGCNVKDADYGTVKLIGVWQHFPSDGMKTIVRIGTENYENIENFLDRCKLILRPLSSVTKTECYDYVKLIAPNASDIEESSIILYEGMLGKTKITDKTHYRFVDYARSIGICLSFMGLDPIAEGWAILDEEFSENAPQEAKKEEKS